MSKQVKNLITKELSAKLKDLDGVAVINPRGISATKNHGIRRRLRGMHRCLPRGRSASREAR